MGEQTNTVFVLAVTVADEVGFSFDEPGDHLTGDGVWEYRLETADGWGWLMAGPGEEEIATEYDGWGDVDIEPYHLLLFKDGALAGVLNPTGGTLGGMFQADVDHIADLEDHLIELLCDEVEHLGGDADEFRGVIQ